MPPPRAAKDVVTAERGRDTTAAARGRPAARPPLPRTDEEDFGRDRAAEDGRASGMRAKKTPRPSSPAATVDEVVADLSNDPRRDRDDD